MADEYIRKADAKGALSCSEIPNSSDSISRQAAIDIVRHECGEWKGLAKEIVKQFNGLPAADVAPVVRCEDCKHHSFDAGYGNYWCNLTSGVRKVKRFDFCSYGERKED